MDLPSSAMREHDWSACADPNLMLDLLQLRFGSLFDPLARVLEPEDQANFGNLSWSAAQRKLRLFACACIRRAKAFGGADHLHAIQICERYADGQVDRAALTDAFVQVEKLPTPIPCDADMALSVFGPTDMVREATLIEVLSMLGPHLDVRATAQRAAEIITQDEGADYLSKRGRDERSQQAHLMRDIFGNPFRPVPLDSTCFSDKSRSVAQTIYEDYTQGQLANLPRLASALKKDAGCAYRELWEHCERPTRHVRGCWVVDLILGKS
jgi:hypothetical protein